MVSPPPEILRDFCITRAATTEEPGGITCAEWRAFAAAFPQLVPDPREECVAWWQGTRLTCSDGRIEGSQQSSRVVDQARVIATALGALCLTRARWFDGDELTADDWEEEQPLAASVVSGGPDVAQSAFYCALCADNVADVTLLWGARSAAGTVTLRLWTRSAGARVSPVSEALGAELRAALASLDVGRSLRELDAAWAPGYCPECRAWLCEKHWVGPPAARRCAPAGHPDPEASAGGN